MEERKDELNATIKPHPFWLLLGVSLLGAFASAFMFVVTIYFSLPSTDLASGQGLFATFGDPFVIMIASTVAFFSGIIASPFVYFGLRRKNLKRVLPFVYGVVLLTITVVTPFSQMGGLCASYVTLLISVMFCGSVPVKFFEL